MKTHHIIISLGVLLTAFVGCGGSSDSIGTLNSTDITKQIPLTPVSIDTNVSAFTFVPYATPIVDSPTGMRPLLAPNSDGTWDVITSTYKKYWEEQKVWSFDLGAKSYISFERLEFNASVEGWAGYTGALDKNRKLYILTRSQPNWHIHTYDADTNSFAFRKYTMPSYMVGGVSVITTGQNDKIYAAGGYNENGKNSTMIVEIDPNTGLMKEYKDIGISNTTATNAESIYVDKTHAYIVTGRIPYRLTALNLSTLEETELGSKDSIIEIGSGSYGAFTNVDAPIGAVGAGAWLYNGGLHTYRQT